MTISTKTRFINASGKKILSHKSLMNLIIEFTPYYSNPIKGKVNLELIKFKVKIFDESMLEWDEIDNICPHVSEEFDIQLDYGNQHKLDFKENCIIETDSLEKLVKDMFDNPWYIPHKKETTNMISTSIENYKFQKSKENMLSRR